jgi:hypothetical protein
LPSRLFVACCAARSSLDLESDWIRCWLEEGSFHGVGGPRQLKRILTIFLEWAEE